MKANKQLIVVVTLVIALAIAIGAHATIITSGLVGRWIFNEGSGIVANDSSGNANNGTLINSAYFITNDPQRGNVLNVNGAYGEVAMPPTATLQPATGTVSVWVKPTVAQTADIVHLDTDLLIQCKSRAHGMRSISGSIARALPMQFSRTMIPKHVEDRLKL